MQLKKLGLLVRKRLETAAVARRGSLYYAEVLFDALVRLLRVALAEVRRVDQLAANATCAEREESQALTAAARSGGEDA